jgi:2-oxoglutarate ferredoxin oxidoreductase subunit alpha
MLKQEGIEVATAHLHHLNPFPKNLGDVLRKHKQIIMPEINTGQLRMLIRSEFLVDAVGINNLAGRAFFVKELADEIKTIINGGAK